MSDCHPLEVVGNGTHTEFENKHLQILMFKHTFHFQQQ